MSPHDTTPAPGPLEAIEAGHALATLLAAFVNVAHALVELEAVAVAIARQLDATAGSDAM